MSWGTFFICQHSYDYLLSEWFEFDLTWVLEFAIKLSDLPCLLRQNIAISSIIYYYYKTP